MTTRDVLLWAMIGFLGVYIPFVMYTPPSVYGYIVPYEMSGSLGSWWYGMRIFMQAAWVAPLLPIWKWNANLAWKGKYFLFGLITGGGWVLLLMSAFIVLDLIGMPPSHPLPISSRIADLISILSFAVTSGFYSLKAKNVRWALSIGILCFAFQVMTNYLVFRRFLSISV